MKKILFAAALAGAAILTACGDKGGGVRMGSLSEFDSLSYVLGANIGNGINFEMRDIPFDFKAIDKGIKESAMGKATQEHDKSLEMLREYFMTKPTMTLHTIVTYQITGMRRWAKVMWKKLLCMRENTQIRA